MENTQNMAQRADTVVLQPNYIQVEKLQNTAQQTNTVGLPLYPV